MSTVPTKDEFEAWKANPVTRAVNRYLLDLAQWQRDRWASGQDWTDGTLIAVQFLEELADLDQSTLEEFYGDEESNETA